MSELARAIPESSFACSKYLIAVSYSFLPQYANPKADLSLAFWAYSIAFLKSVDPDLPVENICFGLDELEKLLKEKTNAAIGWEEAGASAYNRDSMQKGNKIINKTLQVFGYRKIVRVCNFQHLSFLDRHTQLQLNAFFRCHSKQELIELYRVLKAYENLSQHAAEINSRHFIK